ncbi:MAG TPA: hypothetical protein VFF39_14770, partial [Verrucomicrobiae bacterium]|nr:hypothetical protein [Verrucomicrobiae bacterium]
MRHFYWILARFKSLLPAKKHSPPGFAYFRNVLTYIDQGYNHTIGSCLVRKQGLAQVPLSGLSLWMKRSTSKCKGF